jgi:hypothetical protein
MMILNLLVEGKIAHMPSNASPHLKMKFENSFVSYKNLGQAYV